MNYQQKNYLGCLAKTRPNYCKFESPKCCFNCVYQDECMEYAIKYKLMRPCTTNVFEEHEICEFSC